MNCATNLATQRAREFVVHFASRSKPRIHNSLNDVASQLERRENGCVEREQCELAEQRVDDGRESGKHAADAECRHEHGGRHVDSAIFAVGDCGPSAQATRGSGERRRAAGETIAHRGKLDDDERNGKADRDRPANRIGERRCAEARSTNARNGVDELDADDQGASRAGRSSVGATTTRIRTVKRAGENELTLIRELCVSMCL